MASQPLKTIVYEVMETIRQTFDDKKVSVAQAAHWVIIVGNRLLSQHIAKRSSGKFLNVYIVPVMVSEETVLPNLIKGRKYIEIPEQIFDFDMDKGVEYMAYYDPEEECDPEYKFKTIQRTTPSEVQWLMLNDFTKPSPKNPYFWRSGPIFPLVGIEAMPIKQIEVGVYQTISSVDKIDIDAPFEFPEELLEVLKRQVVDLARFSFLFPEDNKKNDGQDSSSDSNKTVPKVSSVNQQPEQ